MAPRRTRKKPVQKIAFQNQPVAVESCDLSEASDIQNNNCPNRTNESNQIHSNAQNGEEPILYIAEPLGKIEEFLEKSKTEIKESSKQITASSSSPASQVVTDSQASIVIEKSSLNLHSPLPKEETFVEKSDQKSSNSNNDLSLNVNNEVSARSFCNDDPKTTDTPIKDNEYLAISILSTLCYSQSECCTKVEPVVDETQSKATTGQHLFCDVSASSPAKCYKILMEGKKEGQLVETPEKSAPVSQEDYSDKSSNLSDIIGYVDPTLEKTRKGSSGIKHIKPHFKQEEETFIDKEETVHKIETKGSNGKKSLSKPTHTKPKKSVKRKLYDAFPDRELSNTKTTNKVSLFDFISNFNS